MFMSCCPVSLCFLNLLLSMLSVRNTTQQNYKKIPLTLRQAPSGRMSKFTENTHTALKFSSFRFTQSTDLCTPWTLLCCVNIKDPWVQGRPMHYKTSDFFRGKHAHTVVYTLQWKPSHQWARPARLLRSRLVSLALPHGSQQRTVTVCSNWGVMRACRLLACRDIT